jgi:hypothetical protein
LIPSARAAIVNHEAIAGFMAAMEMSYPVAALLLSGVNPGDRIEFTIDAGRAIITAIKVTAPAR